MAVDLIGQGSLIHPDHLDLIVPVEGDMVRGRMVIALSVHGDGKVVGQKPDVLRQIFIPGNDEAHAAPVALGIRDSFHVLDVLPGMDFVRRPVQRRPFSALLFSDILSRPFPLA